MMIRKEVQGEWFGAILRGSKHTEGRPCVSEVDDMFYRSIAPGTNITFFNGSIECVCRVKEIIIYDCLDDYLDKEWEAASGNLYATKEATINAYLAIKRSDNTTVFAKTKPVAAIKF